ncbi:MAG: D-glycero-beta-D-manno-heptose-7-phosphate kinase [Rhizobiaceae bacterium]|nr:D-glycero-beta-D-manno-heptose-7-phosphate kinase [Rhizobiaceae bacterium]
MSGPAAEPSSLEDHVQRFASARVLCVGDVMLDRFIEGLVKRISPESPVPIFSSGQGQVFPGGAGNVARNIFSLGAKVTLIGVVGEDESGRELAASLAATSISAILLPCKDRPTTEKTRFVSHGQHVFRVDRETTAPISEETVVEIISQVEGLIGEHDAVVLSDYAKGVLTTDLVASIIKLAGMAGKSVIVDPKSSDFGKYAGAALITPNAAEMQAASGIDPATDDDAVNAGQLALSRAEVGAVLITRGPKGMTLVTPEADAIHINSTVRDVYDVVGAGDTVVATVATALGAGVGLEDAVRIANTAAGIAVGKRGTAVVSPDELLMELRHQQQGWERRGQPIMLTLEDAVRYTAARKAEGKKVGFTNGVFDILHPGHISMLQFSSDACDCLIVGLNTDASVKRLKGPERPINTENDRAIVLGALGMVDVVVLFGADTPIDLIRAIKPDVLIKGADYTLDNVVGADVVLANGGTVLLAELVPGVSSTNTIAKARRRG